MTPLPSTAPIILLLLLSIFISTSRAFYTPIINTKTEFQLFLARNNKHSSPSKKKKPKRNNKQPKNTATPKKATTSSSSKPQRRISLPGKQSKSTPPWQIMTPDAIEQNIQEVRSRRDALRRGETPQNNDPTPRRTTTTTSSKLLPAIDRQLLSWKTFSPHKDPSELIFLGSYLGTDTPPRLGTPEIAFLGRSNVGKSSLLNRLCHRHRADVARVGKTPGATASVNLYTMISSSSSSSSTEKPLLGMVDLPGFGYAKLSKDRKENVTRAAELYLNTRKELALGILLLDARRGVPTDDDKQVLSALYEMGVPLCVVATKIDKVKRMEELEGNLEGIRRELKLPPNQPLRVSGVTGEGVNELWRIIMDACRLRVRELKMGKQEEEEEEEEFATLMEDEDEEEGMEYDQGYDWEDPSTVKMFDDETTMTQEEEEDNDWEVEDMGQMREYDIKSLKKTARTLERKKQV